MSKSGVVSSDVKGGSLKASWWVDPYLRENCEIMHTFTEKDWDNIGLICGYEGDGKTVLGITLAYNLYADFTSKNTVFDAEEFSEAVDRASPGEVIIWDEADELTAHWASERLQAIKRKMKRIRKLRLHIILITPTPFDMNKYFIIMRTRWLIHVYAKGLERGHYRFFNRDKKKDLYINGKKTWDWYAASPSFFGKFGKLPDALDFDWDDYERRKDAATQKILVDQGVNGKERKTKIIKEYREECIRRLYRFLEYKFPGCTLPENFRKDFYVKQTEVGGVFGVKQQIVSNAFRDDTSAWVDGDKEGVNVERTYTKGRLSTPDRGFVGEKFPQTTKEGLDSVESTLSKEEEKLSIGKGSVLGGKE